MNKKELQNRLKALVRNFDLSQKKLMKIKEDNANISERWWDLLTQYENINCDLVVAIEIKNLITEDYTENIEEFMECVKSSKESKELNNCLQLKADLEMMKNNRRFEKTLTDILYETVKNCENPKTDLTKTMEYKLIKDFHDEFEKAKQPKSVKELEDENLKLCEELIKILNYQYSLV